MIEDNGFIIVGGDVVSLDLLFNVCRELDILA